MAFKGNLCDFSITQILNLIKIGKKTGTLKVVTSGDQVGAGFKEGTLSYAHSAKNEESLPTILYKNNKITCNHYNVMKNRAREMSDKELGLLLVNGGYIKQEDIFSSLQYYCSEIIRSLFGRIDGIFSFESEFEVPEGKILLRMPLDNLIIEGARQLREFEQLKEEIPNLEMKLKLIGNPESIRGLNLGVEEWRVISFVNPDITINQIAQATKLNDLEIRRVIYGLLQAGIIEVIRPALSGNILSRMFATSNHEEQKSILNRLITRVRNL